MEGTKRVEMAVFPATVPVDIVANIPVESQTLVLYLKMMMNSEYINSFFCRFREPGLNFKRFFLTSLMSYHTKALEVH